MSTENTPEDAQPAEAQHTRGNPFVMFRAALRIRLQQLRQRFAGFFGKTTDGDTDDGTGGTSGARDREVVKEIVYVSVPADPPPLARTIFIALLMLTVGLLAGAWVAYKLFAARLDDQAEQIDQQRVILIDIEKENRRMQRDRDELFETRKALTDTQKALFETQRDLSRLSSFGKTRRDEQIRASISARANAAASSTPGEAANESGMRGTATAARQSSASPAAPQQPMPGTCNISGSNPQEALSRCIDSLNQ
ncbi:protein of unknown function [Sterolibacterium denitrificans]|uniref:Uncharacterized protein n=1 Tax=Sterolibacterium denitrificans TaxID=157592 RepID=A0A7Z7HP75_9PROT|nr:hypothetical protein [Sterolibacterium denitrificans]SMB22302.1 protein of unknown function [Sterolibacterium denitrificans]